MSAPAWNVIPQTEASWYQDLSLLKGRIGCEIGAAGEPEVAPDALNAV